MDFGDAKFIKTRYFNNQLLIFDSVRDAGKAFKFCKKKDNTFVCSSCKKLGKTRQISVVDGRIIGIKHPEDDHHPDCKPVNRELIAVMDIDRTMRSEVRKHCFI